MTSGISFHITFVILYEISNVTLTSQAMIGQSVFELQQRKSTLF